MDSLFILLSLFISQFVLVSQMMRLFCTNGRQERSDKNVWLTPVDALVNQASANHVEKEQTKNDGHSNGNGIHLYDLVPKHAYQNGEQEDSYYDETMYLYIFLLLYSLSLY